MASPNRRTWTLAGLDRRRSWRLWFDPEARRWEVADLDAEQGAGVPAAERGEPASATAGCPLDGTDRLF